MILPSAKPDVGHNHIGCEKGSIGLILMYVCKYQWVEKNKIKQKTKRQSAEAAMRVCCGCMPLEWRSVPGA